jgi:hypothetical protein
MLWCDWLSKEMYSRAAVAGHDRPVNGRDRRYHKGVLASEKLGSFLDVDVDARIAEQP